MYMSMGQVVTLQFPTDVDALTDRRECLLRVGRGGGDWQWVIDA